MKQQRAVESGLASKVERTVREVVGPGPRVLHEPSFKGNEWKYLKECLDSSYVSSIGKFVDRFEAELAAFTGAAAVVVVVNGTAALQIALQLAGVQPGDAVLVPTLTFAATANAVVYCGATPHFVDSEERTLGMDPGALCDYLSVACEIAGGRCVNRRSGRVVRALVPMHTFGHPADIEGLLGVARDYHLAMVEDAAESLGSTVGGKHTGTFGLVGVLSFNGNKTITTGGGGAILSNDVALARRAKHLTTTAKINHRWEYAHDQVGYNFRMPNLNAALGCAQLEQLPDFIVAKRRLYERYRDAFNCIKGVRVVSEPENAHSNYWLQALMLDEEFSAQRDEILTATNDAGLMTRPVWTLMHRLKHFADCPRMELTVAESIDRRLVNLPSSAFL